MPASQTPQYRCSARTSGETRNSTHCPGLPGTCGTPGAGSTVVYRWPVDEDGGDRYVRHSALSFADSPFTTLAAGSAELADFKQHLEDTGCKQNASQRSLDAGHWGTDSETIPNLLGQTVTAGQFLAWAGNTGPGGKRGAGGPNTHLHIFFARRDPSNNEWYFFDPYGIYGPPDCYPAEVTGGLGGFCVRYPVAWKRGRPQYP